MEIGALIKPRVLGRVFSLVLIAPACMADIERSGMGNDDQPMPPGAVALEIVSPLPGSTYTRDFVGQYGALVALVDLAVSASGSFARIDFEMPRGDILGSAGADLMLWTELAQDGPVTVMARAYDEAGRVVATDMVEFSVAPPPATTCHEWLDRYGIKYTVGPSRDGVDDPVTVTTPINGVSYRYSGSASPRATFFMDCTLALSLAEAAHHLRRRDIIEVVDIGVYNYRCIGEGTPPDCPRGMSQHSYARAIDIAGLITGEGIYYSVHDDWIIDPVGEQTCAADTEPGKDSFLHEVICDLKADDVWNIVLTPNYNADHRDHFHVDLSLGSDFIKSTGLDMGPDDY